MGKEDLKIHVKYKKSRYVTCYTISKLIFPLNLEISFYANNFETRIKKQ